jgi:NTE family protein
MAQRAHPDLSIGLALSGGGARCMAQVGAIKALDEEGIRIVAIAANSSAAIVAALYASGHSGVDVERIFRDTDFGAFLEPDGATGLIGHEGVERLLEEHAVASFEELRIPVALPTVDIERAEVLVHRRGPLVGPVCASNAFPGLFTPVRFQDRNLMDGGMVNNFPVDLARMLTTAPVVAIDVRPSPSAPLDLTNETPDTLLGKVGALFREGVPTSVQILMQAYNITQDRLLAVIRAIYPPDLLLRPALPHDLDVHDFHRLDEALELGYVCVKEAVADGRFAELAPARG